MHASKSLVRQSRVRRSASEWQDIFQQFSHSGQTQEIFCTEQSIALSTFNRWRQRLNGPTELTIDEAASFIATLQKRQGLMVSCPEEIALGHEWIDADKVCEIARPLRKNGYGQYLMDLIK